MILLICMDVLCGNAATHVIHFLVILLLQTHHARHRHHHHDCKDHDRGHGRRHHTVLVRALKLTPLPVVPPVITYGTPTEKRFTSVSFMITKYNQIFRNSGNVSRISGVISTVPAGCFYTTVYHTHPIVFTFYRGTWVIGRSRGVDCRREGLRRNQVWYIYRTEMANT